MCVTSVGRRPESSRPGVSSYSLVSSFDFCTFILRRIHLRYAVYLLFMRRNTSKNKMITNGEVIR